MKHLSRQNMSPFVPGFLVRTTAALALMLAALSAQAIEVTGGFTGWWGQPDQQNHGLIVSVSRLPNGEKTGVLYWAHFDDEGNPSWLFAQGEIDDDMIEAAVYAFEGITFMQNQSPDANFGEQVGTMEVTFSDCLSGEVQFDTTTVGAGSFQIQRLTNQPGATCSGGISDDMRPGDLPQRFDIALEPTGAIVDAAGSAEFDLTPGRADFEVEIENVPAGDYELRVGGEARGLITVVETSDGPGSGEIEFRSPANPGKQLLDFDPRGQAIEVLFDGEVVLSATAPEEGDRPGNGQRPDDPPGNGSIEIEIELANESVYPDGEASAEFETSGNRSDFEIEVENIPAGTYALFVGGTQRGLIEVVEDDDGETEGEIEFRFPGGGNHNLLDFDPRGQDVEIFEGETRLFFAEFPAEAGDDEEEGENEPGKGPPSNFRTSIDLDNTGVLPDASAHAKFDQRGRRTEFLVVLDDAPAGMYPLFVGGIERGVIDVFDDEEDDDTRGRLRFVDPPVPAHLPLDFDPSGELVEIFDAGTAIFSAVFPE